MPTERPPIRLPGLQAVILDLDDTLYPEQAYAFSGFAVVSDWLRARLDCPFDPAEHMRSLFLAGQHRQIFDRVLADLIHSDPQSLLPEMIHLFRTHSPRIELYPDARAALAAWHGRFRLGLISDGTLAMQQAKVDALGLAPLFDEIILTGQWPDGFAKPHPRAFERMETRLGLSGPALVYVADNCGKDFVAPNARGWRTVWMHRPGGIYHETTPPPGGQPQFQVQSFAELDLG